MLVRAKMTSRESPAQKMLQSACLRSSATQAVLEQGLARHFLWETKESEWFASRYSVPHRASVKGTRTCFWRTYFCPIWNTVEIHYFHLPENYPGSSILANLKNKFLVCNCKENVLKWELQTHSSMSAMNVPTAGLWSWSVSLSYWHGLWIQSQCLLCPILSVWSNDMILKHIFKKQLYNGQSILITPMMLLRLSVFL